MLNKVNDLVIRGKAKFITAAVAEALEGGCNPEDILNTMIAGMDVVGILLAKFHANSLPTALYNLMAGTFRLFDKLYLRLIFPRYLLSQFFTVMPLLY